MSLEAITTRRTRLAPAAGLEEVVGAADVDLEGLARLLVGEAFDRRRREVEHGVDAMVGDERLEGGVILDRADNDT